MKRTYVFVALTSFAFASIAQQPNSGQGNAATPPPSQQMPMQQMQQMQQMESRMQAMRALMERIHNSKDPAEQQRLMDEHAKSMQQGMMMMGDMMRGGGAGQASGQCAQNDTQCQMQRMQGQQQMMGKQMGMMQMMMEQMMGQLMMQHGTQPQAGETPQQNHAEHH